MGFGYWYEVMGYLRVKFINRVDFIEKVFLWNFCELCLYYVRCSSNYC